MSVPIKVSVSLGRILSRHDSEVLRVPRSNVILVTTSFEGLEIAYSWFAELTSSEEQRSVDLLNHHGPLLTALLSCALGIKAQDLIDQGLQSDRGLMYSVGLFPITRDFRKKPDVLAELTYGTYFPWDEIGEVELYDPKQGSFYPDIAASAALITAQELVGMMDASNLRFPLLPVPAECNPADF